MTEAAHSGQFDANSFTLKGTIVDKRLEKTTEHCHMRRVG
jgi:hypothetical protein